MDILGRLAVYSSKNFIVTKIRALCPNKFVIVCGYFDSINGSGTNDNGSETSIVMEIARILKDVPAEYSIKFIILINKDTKQIDVSHLKSGAYLGAISIDGKKITKKIIVE